MENILTKAITMPAVRLCTAIKITNMSDKSNKSSNDKKATNTGTYLQRKSMQSAYSDLFRALFQIPDKTVQHRVLDAINGGSATATWHKCVKCNASIKQTKEVDCGALKNAATQTDDVDVVSKLLIKSEVNSSVNSDDSRDTSPITKISENVDVPPTKRKRKRKVCIPQVVKKSHAQQAQLYLHPKNKRQRVEKSPKKTEQQKLPDENTSNGINLTSERRGRSESLSSLGSLSFLEDTPDPWELHNTPFTVQLPRIEELIKQTMITEYKMAEIPKDGLLRIHQAIIENDVNLLRRQIFVWKKMKNVDLNELLTDDDEDCLQLALAAHPCNVEILKILLEEGLHANFVDKESNTCIHLAIDYELSMESLTELMRHIDLPILLKLSDAGQTPLHFAVRHDRFEHAETMLNVLDERLLGRATYERKGKATKEEYIKYYEGACHNLKKKYANTVVAQPKLKKRLLETGELRSGNTALFYAIENKMEHFAYLLLAHLSDPTVRNYGGQDVKSYFSEFGKLLNISFHVDNAMESVIKLLHD